MAFCSECGKEIEVAAKYCNSCGQAISQFPPAADATAITPEPAPNPVLSVQSEPAAAPAKAHSTWQEPVAAAQSRTGQQVSRVDESPVTLQGKSNWLRHKNWIGIGLVAVVGLGLGLTVVRNRAKDYQQPDGTKIFGERTLKDGIIKRERIEYTDGSKGFDVTILPDGTEKEGRVESPDGEKSFDSTTFKDGTNKVGRVESPDGLKRFDVTTLPDGAQTVGRVELPNGEKEFDMTFLPDGTRKIGRSESPDGSKKFNVTILPDQVYYQQGVDFQSAGNLPNAKAAFETVLAKFPASNLVSSAKQRLADINAEIESQGKAIQAAEQSRKQAIQAEEQLTGEDISYVDFWANAKSRGLPIEKRYRFRAKIDKRLTLYDLDYPDSGTPAIYETHAAFDDPSEYENFLRSVSTFSERFSEHTIVASMGDDGYVNIHRLH